MRLAVVGLDLGPSFDCIADVSLVLHGPVHIRRSASKDDSTNFPNTRPIDGHFDVIDTEMVQLILTDGGVRMAAGRAQDVAGLLPATLGVIAEQPGDPVSGDSFFDVFFEIETSAGVLLYNHAPLLVEAKIDCVPPDRTYIHVTDCIALYVTPPGGKGQIVAQFVSANHSTYPACGDPGTGDCLERHDAPFCNDGECCHSVCEVLPRCCTDVWDDSCIDAAQDPPRRILGFPFDYLVDVGPVSRFAPRRSARGMD
ncbi:MAG: hypothetical protein IH961_06880, partial [Chloroflexi bacterium]|nr:hypothetical protein [Chloroflexota bacterium]